MGGNFQRPPFQSNRSSDAGIDQGRESGLNDQIKGDDFFDRLSNLIRRATENDNRIAEEFNNKLEKMTGIVESRINAWEHRFDNLDIRLTLAENQIADMMEASKFLNRQKVDYCQVVEDPSKEGNEGGKTLYRLKIELDSEVDDEGENEQPEIKLVDPKPYMPPLPFPEVIQIAKARRKVLKKVTEALQLIEESHKSEKLMEDYPMFKEHRDNLRACVRWFRTRVGYYGMEKPYPVLDFPYDHFEAYLNDDDDPTPEEQSVSYSEKVTASIPSSTRMGSNLDTPAIEKRRDPGSFKIPCLIDEVLVDDCTLDLGASKSVMPLHVSKNVLTQKLEETDTPIILADWSSIKPVGIARNVLVKVHGFNIPTDFVVIDTGSKESGVILGRPFLSTVGAEIKVRDKEVVFNVRSTMKRDSKTNAREVGICSQEKLKEPPWDKDYPSKDETRPDG